MAGLSLAAAAAAPLADLRESPAFLALFAPRLHRDAYRTYVSARPLAALLQDLDRDPLLLHPPGSWRAEPAAPGDAFGSAGSYDRFRLARLYGGTRAMVARGPRGDGDRVTESWTLISPYPDPTLSRLEPGTLVIVLAVPQQ